MSEQGEGKGQGVRENFGLDTRHEVVAMCVECFESIEQLVMKDHVYMLCRI